MMSDPRYQSLERRYRRAWRWGLVLSIVGHALLFLTFDHVSLPPSPFAAAGERRGDPRAAVGGGMEAVALGAPAPAEEPRPEVREEPDAEPDEPVPEPPEPRMEEVAFPSLAIADALLVPGPIGPLTAPGLADGAGEGDGGTEAEGRYRVVPPRPRGLILTPRGAPDDARGKEVEVWVYVSSSGRVVPDSTRLNPPTGDRRFDRRLRDHAAGWVFDAARRDGRAVGEWFRYTIIM